MAMSSLLCRGRSAVQRSLSSRIHHTLNSSSILTSSAALSHVPSRIFSGGAVHPEGEVLNLTGRQYEAAILGNFPDSPTVQPFGTLERPALIYSGHNSRIVGCIGGGNFTHRLQWFALKEGKKHVCSHCGQVFKLVTDNNFDSVKDIVDQRTRDHYEYFKTLAAQQEQAGTPPVATPTEVGPYSKY